MTKRVYESDGIVVYWNSELCIHTGLCFKSLPEVFDPGARPWVSVSAATADAVAEAVERCPSAALTYERTDGVPGEVSPEVTTVVPRPNGPLVMRGRLEISDVEGATFLVGPRATLCRCGASQNQPFCDRSHVRVRFRDNPRVVAPERGDAESPGDLASPA